MTGGTRRRGRGRLARAGVDSGFGYFRDYDRELSLGVKDSEPGDLLAQLRKCGVRAAGFEVDLRATALLCAEFARRYCRLSKADVLCFADANQQAKARQR